ncbi:ATP-binding cassette domain-containing protein [Mycoplasma seminis]|uniref:ABC transporter ATP-binding protein n=1 Tax=Mycoplasma seminis TaxID=512749 RepID=A0ABY9HC73_9MOLU|nr:ABC transporter ATP-binding protein [Mycoplasma seminis]WLP85799.1 ABC transporter ATP-binding protein [Mycoplasma seminis]
MLKFKNVALSYEGAEVLSDLNFEINKNEIIGLIGKSGEGKSTILKSIFDFSIVLKGEILYNGQNILKLKNKQLKQYKNNISFTDSETLSLNDLDAYKNILYNFNAYSNIWNKYWKILTKEQINILWSLFNQFGVEKYALTPLNQLSTGQKQRFNFISGVFKNSEILICDEITSNLDLNNSQKVYNHLLRLKNDKIIITAIHDIDLAMQYCDKLIAVKSGKIQKIITKEQFDKEELLIYFDE